MRYVKEVRFRFNGPEAQRYTSLARTILGRWLATLGPGVITGADRRTLPDGTTIEITLASGEPTIAITTRGGDVVLASRPGIVVTPRNDTYPTGQDDEYPEALLAPLVGGGVVPWGVQWAQANIPGFRSSPQPKGLYLGAFPDGLKDGGNIDWRGPRGERLSWYGPASRYWHDPQEPNTFPRQWLFAEGRVLLDATAYAAEQEDADIAGGIMGAALWTDADSQRWLHVIHKDGNTHRLVRYTLSFDATDPRSQQTIITGFEKVTTLTLADSRAPWFFSEDGSKAVHMTDPLPTEWDDTAPASCTTARLEVDADGSAAFSTASDVRESPTLGTDSVGVIARDFRGNAEVALSHAGESSGGQGTHGHLQGDFGNIVTTLHMVGVPFAPVTEDVSRLLVGVPVPSSPSDPDAVNWSLFRRIFYADLRAGVVLCLRSFYPRYWLVGGDGYERFDIELWREGRVVKEWPVLRVAEGDTFDTAIGMGPWHAPVGGQLNPITEGSYSPRLWMLWKNDFLSPSDQFDQSHRGLLASCAGNLAPWKDNYVRSGWADTDFYKWYASGPAYGTRWTFRDPFHVDGRGHSWLGVVAVERDRVVVSWYLPNVRHAPLADSAAPDVLPYLAIDTGRAANFLTRGLLPIQTGTPDVNSAFYPGWPLGRPLL